MKSESYIKFHIFVFALSLESLFMKNCADRAPLVW